MLSCQVPRLSKEPHLKPVEIFALISLALWSCTYTHFRLKLIQFYSPHHSSLLQNGSQWILFPIRKKIIRQMSDFQQNIYSNITLIMTATWAISSLGCCPRCYTSAALILSPKNLCLRILQTIKMCYRVYFLKLKKKVGPSWKQK